MTSPDLAKTLHENFLATAADRPDAPALTFLDADLRPTDYTYRELFARAGRVADALAAHRLDPAAPLGLLLQSQEAQVLHYLAALALGLTPAILTPPNRKLNREYYQATMRAVTESCHFAALVADEPGLDVDTPVLEPWTARLLHGGPGPAPRAAREAALLQFSSGTTGFKRGVPVTDRAALLQLRAYAGAIGLADDDRIVSWLPLYHDMGFMACLNMPLLFGVPCVMLHPLDWVARPGLYLRAASRYRATLGWNPNFAYAFLADRVPAADLEGVCLASLRGLVNCSEPVTAESQQRFLKRYARYGLRADVFWGCYAMAETMFALTHGRSEEPGYLDAEGPADVPRAPDALPFVSVGRTLEGVELRVTDERGEALADRRLGELWARAPFTFGGYHGNPEATRAAFHDGWYKTGDLGYRVGDRFFVCGRKKDLLIVGGVNVFPQDVEDLLAQVEGVRPGRVAAFAEFDARHQTERLVVLAETGLPPEHHVELVVRLRQRVLAAFQVANFEIHLVPPEWLVKSSAGKMARGANRRKWAESRRAAA